jgi:hypothetical protein
MKTGPRPKRSKGTWFVSFEPKERLRAALDPYGRPIHFGPNRRG